VSLLRALSAQLCLHDLIRYIYVSNVCVSVELKVKIVPGGFEPPSRAPKALRIDRYPTGLYASLSNPRGVEMYLHKIYMGFPGEAKR
jgi:hypothetical protein